MVLDAQNTFSDLGLGDSPTAVGDSSSGRYIDQMVAGLNFSPPGGGSYVAMWLVVQVTTAFATGAAGTVQAVLQDSPDGVTWTDRVLGAVFSAAAAAVNIKLMQTRILPSHERYVRVAYRIATGVMTAGTCLSFLTPDIDVVDIAMRKPLVANDQLGQISEAVSQGILRQ